MRGFSSQRITLLIHFLSVCVCVCVGVDGWVWGGWRQEQETYVGVGWRKPRGYSEGRGGQVNG